MMTNSGTWLTVQEAADALGVSPGRVRQLIVEKRIHGQKFGPAWAISTAEVERFRQLDRPPGNPQFKKK